MAEMGEGQILESWKEISSYLKRTVRTCCRWEERLGLPVHRLDGSSRARVYAYKNELELWLQEKLHERDKRGGWEIPWLKLAFVLVLAVGLTAASLFTVKGLFRKHESLAGNPIPVLAVLPLQNETGDATLDHVCRFFQRCLSAELRRTPEFMTVVSESSVNEALVRLKLARNTDYASAAVRSIADRVSASHILVGQLSRSGDKWRVNYEIQETRPLRVVDSGYVDGSERRQDRLAGKLAGKILSNFGIPPLRGTRSQEGIESTLSIQAARFYDEAVKAEWAYTSFHDEATLKKAMEFYRKTLDEDPDCALAYVGLGNLFQCQYVFYGKKDACLESMVFNYRKAHELGPELAEANLGLGWISFFEKDNDKAYGHFKRAFDLAPSNPFVNFDVGAFLGSIGLLENAVEYLTRAVDFGERSASIYRVRAHYLEQIGDYEGAAGDSKKLCEMEPMNCGVRCLHARILLMMGEFEEAEWELAVAKVLDRDHLHVRLVKALLCAARGEKDKAFEAMAPALEDPVSNTYFLSQIYAALGYVDEATANIEWALEHAFEETQTYVYSYVYLNNWDNLFYDSLRGYPRFQEILEREKEVYRGRLTRYGGL